MFFYIYNYNSAITIVNYTSRNTSNQRYFIVDRLQH